MPDTEAQFWSTYFSLMGSSSPDHEVSSALRDLGGAWPRATARAIKIEYRQALNDALPDGLTLTGNHLECPKGRARDYDRADVRARLQHVAKTQGLAIIESHIVPLTAEQERAFLDDVKARRETK